MPVREYARLPFFSCSVSHPCSVVIKSKNKGTKLLLKVIKAIIIINRKNNFFSNVLQLSSLYISYEPTSFSQLTLSWSVVGRVIF